MDDEASDLLENCILPSLPSEIPSLSSLVKVRALVCHCLYTCYVGIVLGRCGLTVCLS